MNNKSIFLIIVLMTLALVGIAGMQAYWIHNALQLHQKQFNKGVMDAMNSVVNRLEMEEIYMLTESMSYQNIPKTADRSKELPALSYQGTSFKWGAELMVSTDLNSKELVHISESVMLESTYPIDDLPYYCTEVQIDASEGKTALMQQVEATLVKRMLCVKPLAQRMEFAYLEHLLQKELWNRGIETSFGYGVKSLHNNQMIFANNPSLHQDSIYANLNWISSLNTSPYRISLFPNDLKTPGILILDFPKMGVYMFSSVWNQLAASFLLLSVIVFCFAFTISVIFKQKKIAVIKNDFINNMTHEFKTPIATISLAADSISNPLIISNEEKIKRFANIIKEENKRMNNQVEKVLQIAVLDKGDFSLNRKEINVHLLIDKAVNHIALQVDKREGKIETQLDATQPIISADETLLSNVIHNLLDNANKYSPDTPEILVKSYNTSSGIKIVIKDKGIGMSKEDQKRVFDKFYRVSTGNRHDIKGFGLGLSYVKAIMDMHKGEVKIESELGKGSSFELFLPFKVD